MRFIMANVRTLFFETSLNNEKKGKSLEVMCKFNGDLCIDITDESKEDYSFITLDKETAIKLSRELKKQISLMY